MRPCVTTDAEKTLGSGSVTAQKMAESDSFRTPDLDGVPSPQATDRLSRSGQSDAEAGKHPERDILADARVWLSQYEGQIGTHSEDCHQWHAPCLVARLAREVERLRAAPGVSGKRRETGDSQYDRPDIVSRLRRWTHDVHAVPASDLMDEAADVIEEMRRASHA
jgi:hypothetical protein